jgi:HPt (histidine-containing phosphotransfer) domain-containing protein
MVTRDFSGIKNNGPLPKSDEIQTPDDIGDLLMEYVDSTNSLLDELETAALSYETGSTRHETAAAIRRILHKIKGESSMVGIEDMSELCHHAEDAFEDLPENKRVDMLLRFKDWASTAMQKLAQGAQN